MFHLGGKKKDQGNAFGRAMSLASEGKSEGDIIKALKKEGFGNEEIGRALNQLLKSKVSGPSEIPTSEDDRFVAPPPAKLETMYGSPEGRQVIEMTEEEEVGLEELIEEIVNERWGDVASLVSDLKDDIRNIQDQIGNVEGRLSSTESGSSSEKLDMGRKLEELEMKLEGMDGRMASVEKMLKEILPNLTDNVRSLSKVIGKKSPSEDDFDL